MTVHVITGGSSPTAWDVGAAEVDLYRLFGEPFAGAAEERSQIVERAAAQGRTRPLRHPFADGNSA